MSSSDFHRDRRRKIAHATLWGMVSFGGRRAVDMVVLWLVGRWIDEGAYGLFRQWIAVVTPLYILVAGGWDIALLRRRQNKAVHFRALILWAFGSSALLGLAMIPLAEPIARDWYRAAELAAPLRWAWVALLCEAGRRVARSALADRLEFGAIAIWELIRALTFGVLATVIVAHVKRAPEPPSDALISGLFVASFALAEFIEAAGLLFFQRRGSGPAAELWRNFRGGRIGWLRTRAAFRREARFCAITSLDTFFNAVSVALPVYFLGRYFGPESVTTFSFALLLATIPLYAILESAQRALLPSFSPAGPERLPGLTMMAVEALSLATMPLAIWLAVFAPDIFMAVFHEAGWAEAGYMTRWLLLYLALAPMTKVCDAVEAIKGVPEVGLVWNLTTFAGRAIALWAGVKLGGGVHEIIALYALYSFGMWALYQVLIARMLEISVWTYVASYGRFAWLWVALAVAWLWVRALFPGPSLAALALWGMAGGAFYAALLATFHRDNFLMLLPTRLKN